MAIEAAWLYLRRARYLLHLVRSVALRTLARDGDTVLLERLLDELLTDPRTNKRVDCVLGVHEDDPRLKQLLGGGERGLPGDRTFLQNGWWKSMLTRYALALHYSEGKCVLDSCCGLGWGSFLLDAVGGQVVAVDMDTSTIEFARSLWPVERTEWAVGSVLNLALASDSFDVAAAMESIEHFEHADILRYLDELKRVLKPGGILIGSSSFPATRDEAEVLCSKNPSHRYICTRAEIVDMLGSRFAECRVFHNGMFFWARK